MKKRITAFLLVVCMVLLPCTVFAADTSRSYDFDLSVGGEYEIQAHPEQVITVTLALDRIDSSDPSAMYAMQAEMLYDDSFFELVDNSVMTYPEVNWEDMARRTGGRAFYLNYLSLGGGNEWSAQTVVGSFQMKVIGESGTSTILTDNCIVSTQDGNDSFQTKSTDVTVIVSTDCTVTFEENGGSEVDDQIVRYGEKIREPEPPVRNGYVFNGWYKDLDCTESWNFDADTVKGNMTLYAGWLTEENAEAIGVFSPEDDGNDGFPWWIFVIIGLALIFLILILLFGKKRVSFDTDGGTELEAVMVKKGEKLERPMTPTKSGAMFAGWYQDAEKTVPWNFETDCVEKSMTLYARWM